MSWRRAPDARSNVGRAKPDAKHEDLCRRCGRCCYEKYVIQDVVFTSRTPCPHLDVATNSCRIYADRLKKNSRCMDIKTGISMGVFPADCPYVQGVENYIPSEPGWLDEETVRLIEDGRFQYADELREFLRRKRK